MDESKQQKTPVNFRFAIPFFVILTVLTVCSFIIPLRPTRSQSEKRNLAEFPEFSVESLLSGSYFDDISLWFSDTFPGRENWIELSGAVSELHGYSEISIQGNLPISDQIPVIPTAPSTEPTENTETTGETEPAESEQTKPTLPDITIEEVEPPTEEVEVWGGVNAGEDAQIMYANQTIQIGDTVFNYCAFHQYGAEMYAQTTNYALAALEGTGARLASMPAPTAIGIMVEKEYQQKLVEGIANGAKQLDLAVKLDEKGDIADMAVDYVAPADYLASMDIFVLNKKFLRDQVKDRIAHNEFHMDRDLVLGQWQEGKISINIYQFKGVALFNDTVEEYFATSMALIDSEIRHDLFGFNHPVYTKVRDRVPTYYGEDCEVEDCLIADGCIIEGEAEESVLFRQVTICEGAEVENCVIMNDTVVGEGAKLEYVILDKNVTVRPGARLIGTEKNPIIIKRGETV